MVLLLSSRDKCDCGELDLWFETYIDPRRRVPIIDFGNLNNRISLKLYQIFDNSLLCYTYDWYITLINNGCKLFFLVL